MNELDDNKEVKIMNSKKRKRVVSMLVRTVRSPIQHGYVVYLYSKSLFFF